MNLPANITNMVNAMEEAKTRVSADSDSQFLKLDKVDGWIYGADDIQVEDQSNWAINPNSFATGFQAWDDSEFEDEVMSLITEAPVIRSELPAANGTWSPAIAFQLVCIDGEDKGLSVLYKTTAKGGQKAFKVVLDEVLVRAKAGEAELVPIVHLKQDSYKHKSYGKIVTPVFDIVGWADMDAAVPDEPEKEPEAEKEPEPKPRRRNRARK